ncbi:MAG: hypothetical protein P8L32_06800, partial [Paracoccaceae bacterium]|nr:hypothetical protein [Paracoccaceae bacterium]
MSRRKPEPVQVVKKRRDAVLKSLVENIPYVSFMGISFDRRGDESKSTIKNVATNQSGEKKGAIE